MATAANPFRKRLALWAGLTLVGSALFLRESWAVLGETLVAPNAVVEDQNVAPWAVLVLVGFGLWLKRAAVLRAMRDDRPAPAFVVAGAALAAGAPFLPAPAGLFAAALGLFALFFGRAALIPSFLMALYGLTLVIQPLVVELAETPYALSVGLPATSVLGALGFPISGDGQLVELGTADGGRPLAVAVTAACAGPTTLAVFFALFGVMALDLPLPRSRALRLFLLGLAGTWAQNLVRVTVVFLAGYYRGSEGLDAAHLYAGYLMATAWYVAFAYIYLREWRRWGGGMRLAVAR